MNLLCYLFKQIKPNAINLNYELWRECNDPKFTEIGKKAWLFAKLQPGRARKRINAT